MIQTTPIIVGADLARDLPTPGMYGIYGRKFIKGKKFLYMIDVITGYGGLCWTACRWQYGAWRKVPTFTRADEARFPKQIGYAAQDFIELVKRGGRMRTDI